MSERVRRPVLAIIGDGDEIADAIEESAHELGRLAIDAGYRLVTGGLGGVMGAASRGARGSAAYQEGRVLAILPGYDAESANEFADVVIPTGLGHARNVIVVATADVVVAVGGQAGTLSEMALAWKLGRPIVALATSGGWAKKLAGKCMDDRPRAEIAHASTAAEAIELASHLLDR